MGEFFKPLRRKIGVVALGLACMLMVSWIRSFVWYDGVSFGVSRQVSLGISSGNGLLVWNWLTKQPQNPAIDPLEWNVYSTKVANQILEYIGIEWTWYRLGVVTHRNGDGSVVMMWLLPYWFVMIPLTLLSVWLLLSKRRAKTKAVA